MRITPELERVWIRIANCSGIALTSFEASPYPIAMIPIPKGVEHKVNAIIEISVESMKAMIRILPLGHKGDRRSR
jgi:hypothetical protein